MGVIPVEDKMWEDKRAEMVRTCEEGEYRCPNEEVREVGHGGVEER